MKRHASAIPGQAERLLDAAARCFALRGFRGATVDDIASEAGVSRPILYKHYAGKDALIDAVLDNLLSEWERQANEHEDHASAAEALRHKIERVVTFAMERPLLQALLTQDPRVLMSGHAELFQRTNEASRAYIERVVRRGQESGEFASDLDTERTTDAIELIEHALTARALGRTEGGIDQKQLAAAMTLLLRGLRPLHGDESGA